MRLVRELVVATFLISVLAAVSCEGARAAEHGGEPSWSKVTQIYLLRVGIHIPCLDAYTVSIDS